MLHPVTALTVSLPRYPRATPMAPPTRLITTASTRNWVRTSEPRAPSASRSPISRVLSVTETSMMFMIPMPPTSREMPAIADRRRVMIWVVSEAVSVELALVLDLEVVGFVGGQPVGVPNDGPDLFLGRRRCRPACRCWPGSGG